MKHKDQSKKPKDVMKGKPHKKEASEATEAAEAVEVQATADAAAQNAAAQTESPEAGRDEAAALREEIAQMKDQVLRAMAEVENTRRRSQRDLEDTRRYAISVFAQDLLNVLDNFYRTEEHLPQNVDNFDPSIRSLFQGIHLTKNELIRVFESHGIRRINPKTGDAFDHNLHQAIAQVPDANLPPNTVAQVVQAGYTIHERLLRPAMVSVSVAPESPPKQ